MPATEHHHEFEHTSTTGGLPVAPSMDAALATLSERPSQRPVDRRVLAMSLMAIAIAALAGVIAQVLMAAIAFVTNLAFYGQLSLDSTSPAGNALGPWVIAIPVIGGLIVGLMARYGSAAIRGHGIPEAMEQILFDDSRIPARVLFLKPLSAVISIGTGGPFGAEGPIIATGGALGSLFGQFTRVSTDERKTLLAAGAAAGMAATFGAPVSAVLLAVELLLFEYRPRSLIPVSMAAVTATGVRIAFSGTGPAFAVIPLAMPSGVSLFGYVGVGLVTGVAAVLITKAVYAVEDAFERLPIHWMWWPAVGAVVVGLIGVVSPHTMGVGYDNIENIVSGHVAGTAVVALFSFKLVSWLCSLGSGTSGGTLAPLFIIGGGLGATVASGLAAVAPWLGVDPRMGALVGMAAVFAGASRALLASVVFAFEATHQSSALLPLLCGCSVAFLLSYALMETSIMTEKIVRRGRRVPAEYIFDFLDQVLVSDVGLRQVNSLEDSLSVGEARAWLASGAPEADHHGFPVIDSDGRPVGLITRRDLFRKVKDDQRQLRTILSRPVVGIAPAATLRQAADLMVHEDVGRLVVLDTDGQMVGIVTRSDLIEAHASRLASLTPPAGSPRSRRPTQDPAT